MLRDCLPQGTLLNNGRYKIDWPLGKGGYGITYRAIHTELERPFAIKEFFPQNLVSRGATGKLAMRGADSEKYQRALDKFHKEAQSVALIDHPNVTFANDVFMDKDQGTAYLVMNLVTGRTLRQELEESPDGLPEERVRKIMSELVAALAATHDLNVSHLDIKPENVMISEADGRTVLVDFGAARVDLGVETIDPTTQPYTYAYVAPEVLLRGKDKNIEKPGPYSDIFELGMLLHELLTGAPPPPVLDRIISTRIEELDCSHLGGPWAQMVTDATRLTIANRPKDVAAWWNYEAQIRERHRQHQEDEKERRRQNEIEQLVISHEQAETESQQLISVLEKRQQKLLAAQQNLVIERDQLLDEREQLEELLSQAEHELYRLENSLPKLLTAILVLVLERLRQGATRVVTAIKKIGQWYQDVKAEEIHSENNRVTISLGGNKSVFSKAELFRVGEISFTCFSVLLLAGILGYGSLFLWVACGGSLIVTVWVAYHIFK